MGDEIFDVGMGAYHGSQVCELVGLFMMSRLMHIKDLGLVIYRDDVLDVTRATSRPQEKMRQRIVQVFREHGLSITIFITAPLVKRGRDQHMAILLHLLHHLLDQSE